jgi:hypothetical protein
VSLRMATAAEAQVEGPAPPPPRAGEAPAEASNPAPEKRAPVEREEEDEGEEQRPEPKRRRARVAPLESVPRAANVAAAGTASSDISAGGCDGEGFTFHARSFVGVETTPKFGSFNPGLVELDALDPRRRPDFTTTQEGEETEGARGGEKETAEGSDGNSR